MNVVGIDPSLSATGVCWGPAGGETIKLQASNPQRLWDLQGRIEQHLGEMCLAQVGPRWGAGGPPFSDGDPAMLAVIEDLPMHANSAGLTGQAQGVVRAALQSFQIPFITVAPASLKLFATGSGKASKEMMRSEMERQFGRVPEGWDDNTVDAFWLREVGVTYVERFGEIVPDHFKKANVAKWSDLIGEMK